MSDAVLRPKPYPWPWRQSSILDSTVEENQRPANSWLDADLEEPDDDASDSDYAPSEGSESGDSDETNETASEDFIGDSELADISADAEIGWPSWPTQAQQETEEREDLARKITELVKAEQKAAADYDPEVVVALVTELYELLVSMGQWPENSLLYAPHTAPPKLPYAGPEATRYEDTPLIPRTKLADYTREDDLREGRRPYPYLCYPDCPDLDPWLLPLALPGRDGWNDILDTRLGAVRAYETDGFPPEDTIEFRRHGEVPDSDAERERATWTEYRRAPLVPAAGYLSEVIYAYRSLARLPVIEADHSAHAEEKTYPQNYPMWIIRKEQEHQEGLLTLYRECGWPDNWRRAEFVARWKTKKKEIDVRAREAMQMEYNGK
ncbi:hypothetical protein FB451DRAFT_1466466 [Mycena latifolia]|nr:hypothetical protein FB451DRAFT_1466466 [Mycena latifolia]